MEDHLEVCIKHLVAFLFSAFIFIPVFWLYVASKFTSEPSGIDEMLEMIVESYNEKYEEL